MMNRVEYITKLNNVMYHVSNHKQMTLPLALIDRGANGSVAGSDTWLIDKSLHSVHIQGINDHMIKDIPIGTVGAVINTQCGEVAYCYYTSICIHWKGRYYSFLWSARMVWQRCQRSFH
jgi:hypothetical protein